MSKLVVPGFAITAIGANILSQQGRRLIEITGKIEAAVTGRGGLIIDSFISELVILKKEKPNVQE